MKKQDIKSQSPNTIYSAWSNYTILYIFKINGSYPIKTSISRLRYPFNPGWDSVL